MDLSDPKYATLKRLVTALVGVLIISLNKKLGLSLGDVEIAALTSIVLGYIAASNYKEVGLAKADAAATVAAAKVDSSQSALGVINNSVKALILLCLFAPFAARAQAPDAPLTFQSVQLDSTQLETKAVGVGKGDPAPADGCFLPEQLCTSTGQRIASCEAERDSLKGTLKDAPHPVWFILAGLVVGAGAGFAAAKLLPPR